MVRATMRASASPERRSPAIIASVASRSSASRGELPWMVVSEPSWPVFIASSMSSASAPRTSPTMMRVGRMRSALRTRSRMLISPAPSTLLGAGLQRDAVRELPLELQLGYLFDGHHALVDRGDRGAERVQQGRLAAPVGPLTRMFTPRLNRRVQELGGRRRQRAQLDQLLERVRAQQELADGDAAPARRGRRDRRVQARAVGQPRVDHRRGLVQAAPDRAERRLTRRRSSRRRRSRGRAPGACGRRSMTKMRWGPLQMISSTRGASISGCRMPRRSSPSNSRRSTAAGSTSSGALVVGGAPLVGRHVLLDQGPDALLVLGAGHDDLLLAQQAAHRRADLVPQRALGGAVAAGQVRARQREATWRPWLVPCSRLPAGRGGGTRRRARDVPARPRAARRAPARAGARPGRRARGRRAPSSPRPSRLGPSSTTGRCAASARWAAAWSQGSTAAAGTPSAHSISARPWW